MKNLNNNKKKQQVSDQIFYAVSDFICIYFNIFSEALKTKSWKKKENILLFSAFTFATSVFIYRDYHLSIIRELTFEVFHQSIESLSMDSGLLLELSLNALFSIFVAFFFMGLKPYIIKRKYQKGIDRLRLKSGLDERPKILDVESLNENRTKLLVKSYGLGQDRYRGKLDDLRASVGQKVESVKYHDKDNTSVEIYLAKQPLENIVKYSDVIDKLNKPYSFVVGKSLSGIVTQSIANEMPHLMIGGTTGGGKSNAFNVVVLNLLEKSDNLQMYLIDLKGGLEVKAYDGLSNVELIKNAQDATTLLKRLVDEMDRRYQYLEENNHKKINPKRDKFNRIVIAVDECTDLLGKVPRNHTDYTYIVKAIEYMDKLARKARAAGIHIILATQKIDKSSIPTRIQEMMGGRLALRVKTMENSIRLIGNRMAYDLPAVPGRSIWSVDSDFNEVQIPYISDEEIGLRVKKLKVELESGVKRNFSTKLRTMRNESKYKASKEAFVLNVKDDSKELDTED